MIAFLELRNCFSAANPIVTAPAIVRVRALL